MTSSSPPPHRASVGGAPDRVSACAVGGAATVARRAVLLAEAIRADTHAEWLKYLRKIDRSTPKGKTLHLIADNYATHKHPAVPECLGHLALMFQTERNTASEACLPGDLHAVAARLQ